MQVNRNFSLKEYNSYNINAIGKNVYFPKTENDIIEIYAQCKSCILIGSGYNILLTKEFYDDSFIILNGNFNNYLFDDSGLVEAQAGVKLYDLSIAAQKRSFSGLEVFYDIPGSIGGAVVMNAGASGEEIESILLKVRYLDLSDLTVKDVGREEIDFKYRDSIFQRSRDKVILKVWLQLSKSSGDLISAKMERIKAARWSKQPKEYPNAGSVFKRPEGKFVGPMIEELGLKGYSIGGAKISEKHAGFIVNYNNATGSDILNLISHIKEKVYNVFGVELEVEQRII